MRWNLLVALGLAAVSVLAVVLVACSDSSNCKPNTFTLSVELDGTADYADTITITGDDPGAMVSQKVQHQPGGDTVFNVDVNFPGGYPADKLVHLTVTAMGGVTNLGSFAVAVHTDPTCTVAHAFIRSQLSDMATVD